ncbi:MAG TPA: universal stress protein [Polyangiaceae bacterium]|jgi:nucleotide-binding universal stress UspA family protein|nr:universal stress protein [Polyangiaceae bacterium]
MKPFRKILVPVDFSTHSARAVEVAAELARRYEGSLHLVHVFDPLAYPLPDGYVMFTRPQLDEMFACFDAELGKYKQAAQEAGTPRVQTLIRQGPCAAEICDFAREGAFDLIVMGTHGRRGLNHVLLGSVAEQVLRIAPCPVLTLRAEAQAAQADSAKRAAATGS